MIFGMTDEQYQLLKKNVVQPLKAQNAKVYIFGSRARGVHHPHSDVDLLFRLSPSQQLPPGFISQIKENIEESRFPFSLDLVNEEDLTDSYRASVLATMIELD